ncbi:MAG: glycosyltransferase family 2 protein [Planctomycetota bacterium]
MIISIEVPVFKGRWLSTCIESVLAQTSPNWKLSLLWDGGDILSKNVLNKIKEMNNPQITVYFQENKGIAHSRHFLTEHSEGEFILTLDDDDMLAPDAVEKFIAAAQKMPWAGIIRARRGFIDEQGDPIDMQDWFPFEPRKYSHGMAIDVYNHSQPSIVRRTDYKRTSGWEGFEEYYFAGADCDIYTKIEEFSEIELLDECLYYYRINPDRTSNKIGDTAAEDMWRRITDKTIKRRRLNLKRTNKIQPFEFIRIDSPAPTKDMIDVVVPFWESQEEEIPYEFSRPSQFTDDAFYVISGSAIYNQILNPPLPSFSRFEIVCSSEKPISGLMVVSFYSNKKFTSPAVTAWHRINDAHMISEFVSMLPDKSGNDTSLFHRFEVAFYPDKESNCALILHLRKKKKKGFWKRNIPYLWMRVYKHNTDCSRKRLDACIQSLKKVGIRNDSIHVIEKRQSSAANRNEGIRLSSKPFICFLDDDVEIVSPDLFDVLLEKLHTLNVDMIGPKIITSTSMIFCADPFFNDELMPNPRGLGEPDNGKYNYSSFVPWLPSTFLIVRREVCQSIGGFDENYIGSQHEDVDFCLKARSRGFKCCYVGEVSVMHFNCERNNSHSVNYKYFRNRWEKHRHLFDSSGMKRISY